MKTQDQGASVSPIGLSQVEPQEGLARTGFDPSRGIYWAVIQSLRERPLDWRPYMLELIHRPTGVAVWLGNGTYGIDICDRPLGNTLWGGVTALSSFGLSLKHHRLRKAARRCLEAIAMEARQGGDACGSVEDDSAGRQASPKADQS